METLSFPPYISSFVIYARDTETSISCFADSGFRTFHGDSTKTWKKRLGKPAVKSVIETVMIHQSEIANSISAYNCRIAYGWDAYIDRSVLFSWCRHGARMKRTSQMSLRRCILFTCGYWRVLFRTSGEWECGWLFEVLNHLTRLRQEAMKFTCGRGVPFSLGRGRHCHSHTNWIGQIRVRWPWRCPWCTEIHRSTSRERWKATVVVVSCVCHWQVPKGWVRVCTSVRCAEEGWVSWRW